MHQGEDQRIVLSATDLSNHLGCARLTQLDRAVAEGRRAKPSWRDPMLDVLAQRGEEHEAAYVETLVNEGRDVVRLGGGGNDATLEAMRAGAGAILQAELRSEGWGGYADVLLRVDRPSDLGAWSYEVVDAKLARETRGGAVLQLCLYTDIVGGLQGRTPELMHIAHPGDGGIVVEPHRWADHDAYYRLVRRSLDHAVREALHEPEPYPVEQCDVCKWWKLCDDALREADHLTFVAGILRNHVDELTDAGITTLEALGDAPSPVVERPRRGSVESFERVRDQARVQLDGRRREAKVHELLPTEEGRGLLRLPAPSPGDVFFDIESDRFLDDGGREYLLGVTYDVADGKTVYRAFWGLDRAGERRAFEELIDFLMSRWRDDAGMHVYHFAPYEPTAIRRLVGRHATREREVDRLLRGERLIDLHGVARQGVRASIEKYGLKELEPFAGYTRQLDLEIAKRALRTIERHLEIGNPPVLSEETRHEVLAYNEDDCLATAALRDWLEERRAELPDADTLPRPELKTGEESDETETKRDQIDRCVEALRARLPAEPEIWDDEQRATALLASLVGYFDREEKCAHWENFRLGALEGDDLLSERKALGGLRLLGKVGETPRKKIPIHRYRFPDQEAAFDPEDKLKVADGDGNLHIGEVHAIDQRARTVDIKKKEATADLHPEAVFVDGFVNARTLTDSLIALGHRVADSGLDVPGPHRAARDLILRRPPRLLSAPPIGAALRHDDETSLEAARRLVDDLDQGVLAIQGPPGAGKTWIGSRLITDLVRRKKRVGVTAVSHKVIRNLLEKSLDAALAEGSPIECVHHRGARTERDDLTVTTANAKAYTALDDGKLLGGTAWLWAANDAEATLDYLFVDEAGQMSLAQVLAAARGARNVILLGDPQQLEQPQRGAHPDGADVAALVHLLDGRATMPDDLGLFLPETWRLHPSLSRYTSSLFYDGRLRSVDGLDAQAVVGVAGLPESGLAWIPVEHRGNQATAPEEVDAVAALVARLLAPGVTWRDASGDIRPIGPADVLVVAPYNAHVGALSSALPDDIRVGTVDRFQGQEAPVVIYSMASSSVEDAPRGMTFLHDLHRLNVATSRARALCLLVAAPAVLTPSCRTPDHMRRANALCRYVELAEEITP